MPLPAGDTTTLKTEEGTPSRIAALPAGESDDRQGEPRYFGSLTAKEASDRAAAARTEKKARLEALGSGPREAIALTLHDRLDLLQKATLRALEDCASDDPTLRRSGRQALPRLLDQALGRVEESRGQVSTDDTAIADLTREERAAMIAHLRQKLAGDEDYNA